MVVGQDVAPLVDDDAGAHAVDFVGRFGPAGRLVGTGDELLALNVDHGRSGVAHRPHHGRDPLRRDFFARRNVSRTAAASKDHPRRQANAGDVRTESSSARWSGHRRQIREGPAGRSSQGRGTVRSGRRHASKIGHCYHRLKRYNSKPS